MMDWMKIKRETNEQIRKADSFKKKGIVAVVLLAIVGIIYVTIGLKD